MMFYLVVMLCAGVGGSGCNALVVPGAPFKSVQECRSAGSAAFSKTLLHADGDGGLTVEGFTCLER
jgi:hypothetical protein